MNKNAKKLIKYSHGVSASLKYKTMKQVQGSAVSRKTAFTLAEVLITLGVIGIVAAMTIPTVMNKYQQKLAETRLMKFYSVMNNAIALSEIDNGYKTTWDFLQYCPTGSSYSEECLTKIFEKFFKPYLRITSSEYTTHDDSGALLVYFPDGSAAFFKYYCEDIVFYPVGAHAKNTKKPPNYENFNSKYHFTFGFYPQGLGAGSKADNFYRGKGMEPYVSASWDGTDKTLPCLVKTKLNGWKFPDNCNPFK